MIKSFWSILILPRHNFAKTLLLGLEEIEGEILKISVYFPLPKFRVFAGFLLNWEDIYCLKDISLLFVIGS